MQHPQVREIRPASVDGVLFASIPGGLKAVAARACVRIDPDAGTLAWTSDVKSWGTTVMRLPGRTEPADLPEVRGLHIVTLPGSGLFMKRLVFTDPAGNSIVVSGRADYRNFDVLWPPGTFDPLRSYGLTVDQLGLNNPHQLNRRFPGAARHWYLATFPYNVGIFGSLALLALAVFVYLIASSVIT